MNARVSSPLQPKTFAFSLATFDKDTVLDECLDYSVTYPPGSDAGPKADWKETLMKRMTEENHRTGTILPKPCAEQFSDRTPLATCGVPAHAVGDAGADVALTDRYYDTGTLGRSDRYMKGCLDMGGDWSALPRDSDEYRAAAHAAARRNAEKNLERLSP